MENTKNIEKTLSHFANEVLSRGPEAVLPQNLSFYWLKEIQKMADEFLDANFESRNCEKSGDFANPILSSCIYEICRYKEGENVEISKDKFIRCATIYSISITMETVRREAGFEMGPPSLEDIFSESRIVELREKNPDLDKFFKRVCLDSTSIRKSKKSQDSSF